jgi:hypothetical protein
MKWFGRAARPAMDNANKRPITNFLQTWEATKDGRILGQVRDQEIFIDQVLIHEQLGISKKGAIDVTNATFDEAKTAFKRIENSHAFVKNE